MAKTYPSSDNNFNKEMQSILKKGEKKTAKKSTAKKGTKKK